MRWGPYTRCGRLIQLTPPGSGCSNSFVFFSDPDSNSWVLQEHPTRN
jgi:hypothetical protein